MADTPHDATRKMLHQSPKRQDLDELLRQAKEMLEAMSPEERAAELRAQRISWVYGNLSIDNPSITKEQVERYLVESGQIPPRQDLVHLQNACNAEREACAQVALDYRNEWPINSPNRGVCYEIADRIRERSNKL